MKPTKIISGIFINNRGQILLLRRTKKRKSYPGKWNSISGQIMKGESPRKCLLREVKEESDITNYKIIKKAKPYIDRQKEGEWLAYPYLLKINKGKIKLDKKEHDAYKWVSVSELGKYNIVPGLKGDLKILRIIKNNQ